MADLSASPPFTVPVAGHGSTTPPRLSARAPKTTPTQPCQRRSYPSTRTGVSIFLTWGRRPPPTPPTIDPCTTNYFLDLPSDLSGRNSKPRVSVKQCKSCRSPDDITDIPKYPAVQKGVECYKGCCCCCYHINSLTKESVVTRRCWSPRKIRKTKKNENSAASKYTRRRKRTRAKTNVQTELTWPRVYPLNYNMEYPRSHHYPTRGC